MDASILLIGSNKFLEAFSGVIRAESMFAVEVASHPRDAVSLVQAQQPDLLLLQASHPGCLDLCYQIKAQSQLAWIYCIVIHWLPTEQEGAEALEPLRGKQGMEQEVRALEMGADAYLSLLSGQLESDPSEGQIARQWLRAKLQAGLRRVQNHRELMRTNDILSAIALVDPLTELNNRRAFEWELPRQVQNSRSRQTPMSLLMLDVDFFKTINDTYGHVVGDRALQLVSARLRHNLRFYDTPFRYGGEEFVILLSNTGKDEVEAVANRICELISNKTFSISDGLELTITVSAGVTTLQPSDDAKGIAFLQRADRNLLQAKAKGRNQVIFSDAPFDPPTQP